MKLAITFTNYNNVYEQQIQNKGVNKGEPCTSNYDSNPDQVHVFRFQRNPEERIIWINRLPTKVTVNDDTVLCEKHWPADFPQKSCQGPLGYRPINPPSEFGSTPAPNTKRCLLQTRSVVERNVECRNVSAESRTKRIKVDAEKCDLIGC